MSGRECNFVMNESVDCTVYSKGWSLYKPPPLKGPSLRYSSSSFFTQSKPVWVDDSGKNSIFYVWGFIFHFISAIFKPKSSKF